MNIIQENLRFLILAYFNIS